MEKIDYLIDYLLKETGRKKPQRDGGTTEK